MGSGPTAAPGDRLWFSLFILALCAGLALRYAGLDWRSMSHPELYIPGISLPVYAEPPARLTFADALWWHFHDEPHPLGWYLAMFGWAKLAGTSEWALRLPNVLIGVLTIAALFGVTRRIWGTAAASLAALLLAGHGVHIFWSHIARMYAPAALLALVSAWLLLSLAARGDRRPVLEGLYVLVLVAGTQTTELFWAVLLGQFAWAAFMLPAPAATGMQALRWGSQARLVRAQAIALMLAAPGVLHAVYRARHGAVDAPLHDFALDYLAFGFMFGADAAGLPPLQVPLAVLALLAVLCLGAVLLSLRHPARPQALARPPGGVPFAAAVAIALAVCVLMLWLGWIAHRRNAILMALAALPLLALAAPSLAALAVSILRALLPGPSDWLRARAPQTLVWLLGIGPPLAFYLISGILSVLADRAFLHFVPFLLMLAGAGAATLVRTRWHALAVVAAVIALGIASTLHGAQKPGSPRDYRAISAAVLAHHQPGDLFLFRNRHWEDSPVFYYLRDIEAVTTDHEAALAARPEARVWLVTWPHEEMPVITDARREALAGYDRVQAFEAMRASAELFVPAGSPR